MINFIDKRFFAFFGKVDVAANIGVFKAQFSDLSFRRLSSGLIDKNDLCVDLRLTDRAGLIWTVDLENAYGKAALAGGVDVDEIKIFIINIVAGSLPTKSILRNGPVWFPSLRT